MMSYTDGRRIGTGAFAAVTECTRNSDGRVFARKQLEEVDFESERRFQREVRLMQSMSHPNVVPIIDAQLATRPYWYTMPLYAQSLADILQELPGNQNRAIRLFLQVLDGIQHAHERDIIHRDLSLRNVLLTDNEDAIISDFGLGRELTSDSTFLSRDVGMGTSGFVSPEQYRDPHSANHLSDIYSLGKLLLAMTAGNVYRPIDMVPATLQPIVLRATNMDPARRFQNVSEFRRAIDRVHLARNSAEARQRLNNGIQNGFFSDVSQLAQDIISLSSDVELLHKVTVSIDLTTYQSVENTYPEVAGVLINAFGAQLEHIRSFNYIDTVSSTCVRLHEASTNLQIRITLVRILVEAGVKFYRFEAMDRAADLLHQRRSDAEATLLVQALEPISNVLAGLDSRLDANRLHPSLAALLAMTRPEDAPEELV